MRLILFFFFFLCIFIHKIEFYTCIVFTLLRKIFSIHTNITAFSLFRLAMQRNYVLYCFTVYKNTIVKYIQHFRLHVFCIFLFFHLSNKKPTCAANARRTGKRASNPLYVPYHVFEYSAIFGDKNIAFSRCSHSLFTGF